MLTVDQLEVSDRGSITTTSIGGEDGNIEINAPLISLRRNASITANALGSATGGNIAIATDFLIAPADENSDITANAENNFGGNIAIQAQRLFGIQARNQLTQTSDITASSQLGLEAAGSVEINSLEIDSSQGIVELADGLADDSEYVAAACIEDAKLAADDSTGSFVQSGRGGLPRAATQSLGSPKLWRDSLSNSSLSQTSSTTFPRQAHSAFDGQQEQQSLSEAQRWSRDLTGVVQLLADRSLVPATNPSDYHCLKSLSAKS